MAKNEFLYKKATVYLAQLVLEHLGEEDYKLPTELELSKSHGVSRITARKAFQILDDLKLITRVKGSGTYVSKTATEETLEPLLKSLKQKTKKIAVILPLLKEGLLVTEIFRAIMDATPDLKVLVSISNMSLEREQELINDYLRMGVDGIIIYPIDNDIYNPALVPLSTTNFPLIMVDRYLSGLNFAHVASDHYGMVTEAVKYLIQKHEHILYFNSNTKTNTALVARQESYIQSLNDFNNFNHYFFTFCGDLDPTSKTFVQNFRNYLDARPEITAIITADYASGMHLLQLFQLMGLTYPKDYEIVLLDFTAPKQFFEKQSNIPPFIQQDGQKIGAEAVRLLRMAMDGKPIQSHKIMLPATLVNLSKEQ